MKLMRVASFACMLGTLATLGWMAPAPAAADSDGTDAAIGVAVGTIIGQLLFDGSRQQYYYVHERRRCYVSNEQAWQYRRSHWREVEYSQSGSYVVYPNQRDWDHQRDWQHDRELERQREWQQRDQYKGSSDRSWSAHTEQREQWSQNDRRDGEQNRDGDRGEYRGGDHGQDHCQDRCQEHAGWQGH